MSKYVPIGEICYVYDGPHATPIKTKSGPIYLGIDAVTDGGRLNPAEFSYLSESDYKIWTKRVTPQCDDIVFSYEATLGRYAMIPEGFYGCLGRRLRRWTKGYTIKQPNMDCQPTEITALMRHRAVFS